MPRAVAAKARSPRTSPATSPSEGYKVALADYDPQRTSLDWLAMRAGGSAEHHRCCRLRRRPARGAARHRGAGHRCAGTHSRLGDERARAPGRDHPRAGPAVADRHEGLRALHGGAAGARQGAAPAGAARGGGESRAREHADVRGAGPVPRQAQSAVSDARCGSRRITCAPSSAAWGSSSCRNTWPWPDWKQWEPITKWLGSKKSQPS